MIRINQVKLPVEHTTEALHKKVQELLKYKGSMDVEIVKRSLDARKKPQLFYVYMLDVTIPEKEERKLLKRCRGSQIQKVEPVKYVFPVKHYEGQKRPVIVGMGPAGLFCGYVLAKAGFRPILLERGKCVEERSRDVETFWKTGHLNTESNVQFGEGGAGTFSDGKLNTLIKDKYGRNKEVLRIFVKHGAPKEILYDYKPHIGTDILKKIVRSMREEILASGGDVRFETRVTDLLIADGRIKGLVLNGQEELLAEHVVLALGHSARDTFSMLLKQKIVMEPKPFAIGMRVEHPQELINLSQYGKKEAGELGNAIYKLTAETSEKRGVYTFCMCPGGFVVPAASGPKQVVVNGMSPSNRGSRWSNSGMVVEIRPEDYSELVGQEELYLRNGEKVDADSPLALMAFQERLEEVCWLNGGMKQTAPAQRMDDFMRKKNSFDLPVSSYTPGLLASPLHFWMPEFVTSRLREGFRYFGKVSRGFLTNEATMIGVETRTSAPVRILRDRDTYQHVTVKGLFPCGEGAGYAGGIVSAAIDGERCAEGVYNLESNK